MDFLNGPLSGVLEVNNPDYKDRGNLPYSLLMVYYSYSPGIQKFGAQEYRTDYSHSIRVYVLEPELS